MGFLPNEIKSFSMNELYGADPEIFNNASDLRLLLSAFGPYTGRYLANYPSDWNARVEKHLGHVGEVEAARVRTLLRRANETTALITLTNLDWQANRQWLENALPLLTSQGIFDGLIAGQSQPPNIHQLDEMELPPTTEERVQGTAAEYARVSKILLVLSPEIAFVDPYVNPLKRNYSTVLRMLFQQVAKGRCQKVTLWARASLVFGSASTSVIKVDLRDALYQMALEAKFKPGREIEMILVDDDTQQSKMHGRYLLSIKGGIRLDQGFQQLPQGRLVDVAPIGKRAHDALLDIYFEGKHDMRVVERITFKV